MFGICDLLLGGGYRVKERRHVGQRLVQGVLAASGVDRAMSRGSNPTMSNPTMSNRTRTSSGRNFAPPGEIGPGPARVQQQQRADPLGG